ARFERMHDEWEKQSRDPDDVFFHARDRRQEIKEQIKTLERGLARQSPKRSRRGKRQHPLPQRAQRKEREQKNQATAPPPTEVGLNKSVTLRESFWWASTIAVIARDRRDRE